MDKICSDCEETPGRIYNNADITSGQWVECPHEGQIIDEEEQ